MSVVKRVVKMNMPIQQVVTNMDIGLTLVMGFMCVMCLAVAKILMEDDDDYRN